MPHFDAVAFQAPSGDVALVAMNTGDKDVEFTLVDKQSKTGVRSIDRLSFRHTRPHPHASILSASPLTRHLCQPHPSHITCHPHPTLTTSHPHPSLTTSCPHPSTSPLVLTLTPHPHPGAITRPPTTRHPHLPLEPCRQACRSCGCEHQAHSGRTPPPRRQSSLHHQLARDQLVSGTSSLASPPLASPRLASSLGVGTHCGALRRARVVASPAVGSRVRVRVKGEGEGCRMKGEG